MMRFLIPASIAAAAALVAACNAYAEPPGGATASSASGRQCIYTPNISGFRQGPGDTVIINTNSRDYYEFKTQRYCADRLDWRQTIALKSHTGAFVCSGYDAEIYVPDAIGATYCPVYDMRKLGPDEVAALRARK
jgi:Family of unknown function (DUF6491)